MLNKRYLTTHTTIPWLLQQKVDSELESDEHIEWIDMPIPRFFTKGSIGAFLFGIPWTAFALFWTASAAWGTSQSESPGLFSLFPLFGLPFILIGLCILSAPIWVYKKARKTIYVITDRRAITIYGGRTTTIRSYPPEKLHNIYRREKADGSGDVIFSSLTRCDSEGDRLTAELGFISVRNSHQVEQMIKQLAQQNTPANTDTPPY